MMILLCRIKAQYKCEGLQGTVYMLERNEEKPHNHNYEKVCDYGEDSCDHMYLVGWEAGSDNKLGGTMVGSRVCQR